MEKEIPTYKIQLPENFEDAGINLISLVADPAIEIKGFAFSKVIDTKKFFFNDDKQIIAGPALIPDFPIYRKDEDGEYYVTFSKEEIEKLVNHFNKSPKQKPINIDHSATIVDAYIKANWIIEDEQFDKSRKYGFENLPIGTWFLEVKVEDSELWNKEVKANEKFGFSIEGLLGLSLNRTNKEITNTQIKMNKKSFKFSDHGLKDGGKIIIDGEVAVGSTVYTLAEDGTQTITGEGSFVLADGTEIFTDAEGLINEVRSAETAEIASEAELTETPVVEETLSEVAPVEEEVVETILEDVAPVAEAVDYAPAIEELRSIIADLINRLDAIESNNPVEKETEVEVEMKSNKPESIEVTLSNLEFFKKFGFKSK